jgi:hypothetical protein
MHDDLPDQPETHQLDPERDQQHRQQEQWPVRDALTREALDQQDQPEVTELPRDRE